MSETLRIDRYVVERRVIRKQSSSRTILSKCGIGNCAKYFGKIDPTQANGQGNDMGTQYRTGIYYYNEEQRKDAEETKKEQQKREIYPIATEVKAATEFYHAETNHQQSLEKGGQAAA